MEVTILGTESLGVRGLCCRIKTGDRNILIDPGVALGYLRHGRLPHPCQVAVGDAVRKQILDACSEATDIVISHYHGDHLPLADANPYQIPLQDVKFRVGAKFWCKGPEGCSNVSLRRRLDLIAYLGKDDLPAAEGSGDAVVQCSLPVPHGKPGSHPGTVMMSKIRDVSDGEKSFLHASDIQLLNRESVDVIRNSEPNAVFASGPPLYLGRISADDRDLAWGNAISIAEIPSVEIFILDHHLLRSHEGFEWLKALSAETDGKIISAADFMGQKPLPLEANRDELYSRFKVPDRWHADYADGRVGFMDFVRQCKPENDLGSLKENRGIDI
ncbi:MBL fold metallo-hydrolase [Methanoplanus endosymbiosus]|uniref:Uncharacterized protein n=1 Tax=Methanoplanus endosymbiosus TaxID=33865 RepID=A0A9E7THG8_9EURY|nr:hypothetical protein [Methanoplanus endosymbiosus]UUX92862.1 hypothetical protein L6E24_01670 [Methanoplanus endosymbiosus]